MKTKMTYAQSLIQSDRLDSWYHLSPGASAIDRIARLKKLGVPVASIGDSKGLNGIVWNPDRFKRAYATPSEPKVAYLRPYDVFEYLPTAADYLSLARNKNIKSYMLKKGMLLQTCSGRNLGPAVYVDAYLEQFAISDDIFRIEITDESLSMYTLAFLKSQIGQQLLRRDKSGSVIDHISEAHVASLEIPLFTQEERKPIANFMLEAVKQREHSRIQLDMMRRAYENRLPNIAREQLAKYGWLVRGKDLWNRLDAAFYDPFVDQIRKSLLMQDGIYLKDVATVQKPTGRYKTRYVSKLNGLPMLSGSQILQETPINLQFLHPSSLSEIEKYKLRYNWCAYPADGRAEEALGRPVLTTSDRDGWLASGHVGRIIPKSDINPGWLYLALSTWHVQVQIKSRASGSVVDSTFPEDMEEIILPPVQGINGDAVLKAWNGFSEAMKAQEFAVNGIDALIDKYTL